jgi:hypothetical protein
MYYNIMELNEADKLLPIYQVKSIIETLAPKGFTRPILASFPEKTRAIGELWMRTSKETIQTYIFWSIIYNTVQNNNIIADELELLRRFAREANGVVCLGTPSQNFHVSNGAGVANLTFMARRTRM